MAVFTVGPHTNEIPQITSADTLCIRLLLTDATNPLLGLTGITYNASGMTVEYCKPGESAFTAFPSFGTGNWSELGHGWYALIIRGSTPAELALLDTMGALIIYVKATATGQAHIARRVVTADTYRAGTGVILAENQDVRNVASVTGAVTAGVVIDKTGYALTTPPPTASTIATAVWANATAATIALRVKELWRRFCNRVTTNSEDKTIVVYDDDNTTELLTLTETDDGAVTAYNRS